MDIDLLSKMVKELILDKDEVSLPGVGTFVAEMVPSVFSDKGYTINPPYKRLSFRQKGTGDDSLLIDFYAKCNNLDIETASRIIREFLHEMRHVLETRKSIVFPGLGKLRATRENYFFFVADEDLDIYPEGFGLEPISLKTHEETPAEVSATMAALRGILNPEETSACEVNVNVTPDSVHDFLPSEANVAVKVNIPVREVPVSESTVASSMATEVPSEASDAEVAAESSDTENVDAGVHTAGTSDVESVSDVNAGMCSGTNSVSGAETSGTESGSDVNAGLEAGTDSAADDGEAVASDDNEAASSAAKTGDTNGSQVEATEVPASGSQVNVSAESKADPSDIIDNESGAKASEAADNDIDSVSDREGADAAGQQGEDVAAGQKADEVTTVVSGECPDAAVDIVEGQAHAAECPVAGQKVEESAGAAKVGESAGAEDDAMTAKVAESAGAAVAEQGAAAESGSDMPAAGQGNADNGSSASSSPVAKSASDKSGKVIKTMPGRFSKKKPNWRKVLKWSCIGAVLLALTMLLAFIALAHIAPDFIDSILYSPDELRIINY